jgi:polysaccharide export outer membrane protein
MTKSIKRGLHVTARLSFLSFFVFIMATFFLPSFANAGKDIDNFVIGVEDVLDIRVWENSQLSVVVSVRPDGKVTIPLLGDITAKGLRPEQLRKKLEKSLTSFVRTPTVTVIVSQINSFKVYVLGGGTSPRVVSLKSNSTLLQLFARIGSLDNADIEGVFLMRDNKKVDVDFYNLVVKGDFKLDIDLKPGDMVFVPDSFETRLQVVGAVKSPQTLSYKRGLTIVDAVLLAGGFTEFADPKKVIVFRRGKDKQGNQTIKEIVVRFNDIVKKGKVEKNLILLPGDMIIVKEGIF